MQGIKHLIQCHCVLPQYRKLPEPVFHKFVAFSRIDDEDQVIPKLVSCNNCGAVHNVHEIGKSEILPKKENSKAVTTEAELAMALPGDLVKIFREYKVDLATWEEVLFILDEEKWNTTVTMLSEEDEGEVHGKTLTILSPDRFRVSSFMRKTFSD